MLETDYFCWYLSSNGNTPNLSPQTRYVSLTTCTLQKVCPKRFGMDPDQQKSCSRKLTGGSMNHSDFFHMYHRCLATYYTMAKPCVGIFKQKCELATLWATKTVRATMDEVDELLDQNPNARIIHLIRDPRPVAVSRSTNYSYRGIYSGMIDTMKGGDKVREALVYCGTVVEDILHRRQMENVYPGKIIQVIYEDFVQNPEAYAKAVYGFLDEPLPKDLIFWLHQNTRNREHGRNATLRMNAWRNHLTFSEEKAIIAECQYFYELLNYKWPYDEHIV